MVVDLAHADHLSVYLSREDLTGIDVVAIGTQPTVIFLHYYGAGPADALARGVRAAVDVLGSRRQ